MIMSDTNVRAGSTRDRLITEGLRLFAAKGYRATTVGEIEAAAGLQPRRGALYRHFPSKEALLEEAVRRHVEAVSAGQDWMLGLPRGDVRTEALVLGRFVFNELRAERAVIDVMEREGDRVPQLRDLFRERVSDTSFRAMTDLLRRWLPPDAETPADLDALGVLVLGSLINVHRSTRTFGGPPVGFTEDRLLAAWADLCVDLVTAVGGRA
jgi:AcrR family transcriptional regulator